MGAFITLTVVKSMASLGPAGAVLFIVVAQIASAYLIELIGLFGMERTPFSVRKLIGIGIAIVGILVFQKE